MHTRFHFFFQITLVFTILTVSTGLSFAQDSTMEQDTNAASTILMASSSEETSSVESFFTILREQFIDGDWRFMSPILLCLLIGLAIVVERIVLLNLATSNVDQALVYLRNDLYEGGVEQAMDRLQRKRNSVATLFRQSLSKWEDGIGMVEKTIISYGAVETGKLEKGLVWISLFIAIAPMLGFMGTVLGMIGAFDAIQAAGDISPALVAGGIKTALLTTVAGLIVAIILQVFYNYCVAKIDHLVNDMERASIACVDVLVEYRSAKTIVKK